MTKPKIDPDKQYEIKISKVIRLPELELVLNPRNRNFVSGVLLAKIIGDVDSYEAV